MTTRIQAHAIIDAAASDGRAVHIEKHFDDISQDATIEKVAALASELARQIDSTGFAVKAAWIEFRVPNWGQP